MKNVSEQVEYRHNVFVYHYDDICNKYYNIMDSVINVMLIIRNIKYE